jgi:ABC-type glycerol-3-phosphate transport system permease component
MGMISKVGRRRLRVRLTLWAIALVLIAGSITMLYPFALMLSGSTKSTADLNEHRIVPGFVTDRDVLWSKHAEGLFNESAVQMRSAWESDAPAFNHVGPRPVFSDGLAAEWEQFLSSVDLPGYTFTLGYLQAPLTKSVLPSNLRAFRAELYDRYAGDLARLNDAMGTDFAQWNSVTVIAPLHLLRRQVVSDLPLSKALDDFSLRQPIAQRVYVNLELFYREQFLKPQFKDIETYNTRHGTRYASYRDIRLTPFPPSNGERPTWEAFVRTTLNLLWIKAIPQAAIPYHAYLRAKYRDLPTLNRGYGTSYAAWTDVPLIERPTTGGLAFSDWDAFIQGWTDPATGQQHLLPAEMLRLWGPDFAFREHLQARFKTIAGVNQALGTGFGSFEQIHPPQQALHLADFERHAGRLRWEFATRNYVSVIDYMAIRGRAVWNTIIYCTLAIVGALIVNPLAAYALSRYRPPSTYKLLLVMMMTMAFPPMVTQIPVFLMLRDLSLLNTFWALVLPGLAHGYAIFLLKGFFDSLPQELYESATIDGAGEVRIFWQITMSLSRPILAVVALQAFTVAYSNFIFAMLICQDPSMWTITVWLYQLQARSGQGVILAAVTLAALPTFAVFILCQRVIMRGIVVPVEK